MEITSRELLRKAACGFLVQGHIHNMSGPLQILSMQIELLKSLVNRLDDDIKDTIMQKLEQASSQIERLRGILVSLSTSVEDTPTTLDLNDLIRQELNFWEGDLVFKHEVRKELQLAEEPLTFYAPPAPLNQGLCALFWSFVPALSKAKGSLKVQTSLGGRGPEVSLAFEGIELDLKDPFLSLAQELLGPYTDLKINPHFISLECLASKRP